MELSYQRNMILTQITKDLILNYIKINKEMFYVFSDGNTLNIDINKDSIKVYYSDYQDITQGGVPLLGEQSFTHLERDKAVDVFIKRLNSNRPDKKVGNWWLF